MLHLTYDNGEEWGVKTIPWDMIPDELRTCLDRLRKYEASELYPEQVLNLKENAAAKKLSIGNSVDNYRICTMSACYGIAIDLDEASAPYMFFEHDTEKVLRKTLYPHMKECFREFQRKALTL